MKKISLVVPVYNEEEAIPIFVQAVRKQPDLAGRDVEIVFVNDGSADRSASVIRMLMQSDAGIQLVDLARNFGKEAALFAGLEHSTGDAVIPMDVDLQDPIEVVPQLIARWEQGAEVVLAKRTDRSSDGYLKRKTAQCFYRVHNLISRTKIEENVGDFRLLSRPVVDRILLLPESNLFMKGILSWVGGRTEVVEYKRAERVAGKTKFNGWKLWNLAVDGLTGFSTVPLKVWSYIGLAVALLSFLYAIWLVIDKLLFGNEVPGYPSLMVAVLFIGGVQLISIGVLGEYIGRIYTEVKRRPRYLKK